jgi:hypothetical protein
MQISQNESMMTLEKCKRLFSYDPLTGVFTHRARRQGVKHGARAGRPKDGGYRSIEMKGIKKGRIVRIREHRLAWAFVHGDWPEMALDHINGVKDDNRIANLRLATTAQNNMNRRKGKNNKSGFIGVYWDKKAERWIATIGVGGKKRTLGRFVRKEVAAMVAMCARKRHFGEFAAQKPVIL